MSKPIIAWLSALTVTMLVAIGLGAAALVTLGAAVAGPPGPTGPAGPAGVNGAAGADGADGEDGADGVEGA